MAIKKKVTMAVLGVVTAAAVAGGGLKMYSNAAMSVTSYVADRGAMVSSLEIKGNVESENSRSFYADIDGKVATVYVKEGDRVRKGDLLISYDNEKIDELIGLANMSAEVERESYDSALQADSRVAGLQAEAKRNLKVLDTQINDYQAAITQLESDVAYKRAQIADHGAALQISLIEYSDKPDSEEYEELQKQIASNTAELTSNYDVIEMQRQITELSAHLAACKEYKAEMTSQKASTVTASMTEADKEKLESQKALSEFETQRKISELEAAKEGIRADFDGVVSGVNVTDGSFVAQGSPLLTIDSTESVMVRLNVNKYDIVGLHPEQRANVVIKGKDYSGRVERISGRTSADDIGVDVEIRLDQPDDDIILGLEAKATIETASVEDTVRVPIEAVCSDEKGDYVFVAGDKKALKKYIETGMQNDAMIEVLSGLDAGECVIWNNSLELSEGASIKLD
ncbi:MAG: efflux RND transporter periplasmic adaptor subunit [Lachnospiraceae bacterium]|nr:efflux RND transporter periplasmic adaptor subunit [Lachnospiraceae bacterium]